MPHKTKKLMQEVQRRAWDAEYEEYITEYWHVEVHGPCIPDCILAFEKVYDQGLKFRDFMISITRIGQVSPAYTINGKLVDGNFRKAVCDTLGIKLITQEIKEC